MRPIERTFSIRTVMLTLVCGGVIVMLGTALAAGWLSYREYRDRIGSNLIATSRAIMFAVDDELDEPLAFVNGLASSSSFARGDFNNFGDRARDTLSSDGYIVIIKSADGEQEYVNTSKPPAGSTAAGPSVVGPLRLGKAGKSHLGRIENRWMELIDIPIEDESGRSLYTMLIELPNCPRNISRERGIRSFLTRIGRSSREASTLKGTLVRRLLARSFGTLLQTRPMSCWTAHRPCQRRVIQAGTAGRQP